MRYGYRRLTVLLRREGWHVNAKRIYRLYRDEGLIVRTKQRRKMARRRPVASGIAARPNQRWSMDFVSDKLADGRSFRILTLVDQFTRECVRLEADRSMTGMKVAQALEHARHERGRLPESITVDNGSEFCSRALEACGEQRSTTVFHSARSSGGKRIHREFQWPAARRVFERGMVLIGGRRTAEVGKVPRALQSRAASQFAGGSDARSVCCVAPGESWYIAGARNPRQQQEKGLTPPRTSSLACDRKWERFTSSEIILGRVRKTGIRSPATRHYLGGWR